MDGGRTGDLSLFSCKFAFQVEVVAQKMCIGVDVVMVCVPLVVRYCVGINVCCVFPKNLSTLTPLAVHSFLQFFFPPTRPLCYTLLGGLFRREMKSGVGFTLVRC